MRAGLQRRGELDSYLRGKVNDIWGVVRVVGEEGEEVKDDFPAFDLGNWLTISRFIGSGHTEQC